MLLEIVGPDQITSYEKLDYMKMSVAAKVDGIILQYNGESSLEQAINTAVENGIPVVTAGKTVIMFSVNTKGVMLLPQNVNNLVAQNAYVFILATGMLFCILTGGNIDLSVGSVVCFVVAVGGKMMVLNSMNPYLTMIVMLLVGIAIGAWHSCSDLPSTKVFRILFSGL